METLKIKIANIFQDLLNQEAELDKRKCQMLINAIEATGFEKNMTKKLKQRGLPKTIFVSNAVDAEIVNHLSYFSQVVRKSILPDFCILFSWDSHTDHKMTTPYFTSIKC